MWTDKEIEILEEKYPNSLNREIADELKRTRSSIENKANRLGLKKEDMSKLLEKRSKSRRWTDEELNYLKENYSEKTLEEIGNVLSRTREAVRSKKRKLDLKGKEISKNRIELSKEEQIWIAALLDCDGSIGIWKSERGEKIRYRVYIVFTNTNKKIAEKFKNIVHGRLVKKENKTQHKSNGKPLYYAKRNDMVNTYPILKQILPYLVIKKEQAQLILEFIDIGKKNYRDTSGKKYTKRQHEIYEEIKRLNQK